MGQLTMKITRQTGPEALDTDIEVVIDYDYEPALGAVVAKYGAADFSFTLTDDERDRASALALEQENEE